MGLYPPDDPYLINIALPLVVILLVVGGLAGAMIIGEIFSQRRPASTNSILNHTIWLVRMGGLIAGLALTAGILWLVSPADPWLRNRAVPLSVRWYGIFIVGGAMLGAWLCSRRAAKHGYHPDHSWNQLMLGMLLGVVGARIYYVIFEWSRFNGDVWMMINITTGGLAIHGAFLGALLAVLIYTWRNAIPFWEWLDIHVPGFLLGQGIGRWGNFFNQEAYGVPSSIGFGVRIDPAQRLPPYNDLQRYPPDTLFHATFLYESTWNIVGVGLMLLADHFFGTRAPAIKRWLRDGDLFFFYCIYYSLGRFWIEGLRTDSLYMGTLRTAQAVSLLFILVGLIALVINHRRKLSPAEQERYDALRHASAETR